MYWPTKVLLIYVNMQILRKECTVEHLLEGILCILLKFAEETHFKLVPDKQQLESKVQAYTS